MLRACPLFFSLCGEVIVPDSLRCMPAYDIFLLPERLGRKDERRETFTDFISSPDGDCANLSEEVRADANRQTFTLAASIIRASSWASSGTKTTSYKTLRIRHPAGFLRLDFRSDFERERKTARFLDFAEMLFNLQHIDGFDDRIDQMRAGQIEATFANSTSGGFCTCTISLSGSSRREA